MGVTEKYVIFAQYANQMLKKEIALTYESLRDFAASLFPDEPLLPVVGLEEQQQELSSLEDTIGSERFFFVVDIPSFEITHQCGIQRWLGYPEKDFTLKKYLSIMHPGRRNTVFLVARQLWANLCVGNFALQFMVQRYSSLVALKHYRQDKYLLVKKTSSVFQYDAQNRLIQYLNEFTIIGDYDGEALMPRMHTSTGEDEKIQGGEVMRQVMQKFLGMKIFSPNELQTARRLAYNPGITQAKIAEAEGVSVYTIDTYCKRFLNKARDFFQEPFPSVLDAAVFLRKEGLL
jgi:hypothetical protein